MTVVIQTNEETEQYHLKRVDELAIDHIGDIPQLEEPSEEQKRWELFRLSHPSTWPNVYEIKIGDWKLWK